MKILTISPNHLYFYLSSIISEERDIFHLLSLKLPQEMHWKIVLSFLKFMFTASYKKKGRFLSCFIHWILLQPHLPLLQECRANLLVKRSWDGASCICHQHKYSAVLFRNLLIVTLCPVQKPTFSRLMSVGQMANKKTENPNSKVMDLSLIPQGSWGRYWLNYWGFLNRPLAG